MGRENPKKREEPVLRKKDQELKSEATKRLTPEEMEQEGIGELPRQEDV
ncbi:MAG: hypothetical protein HY689_05985 [Chloroflexi bacterium]|nr:hypothetical protein [Chloroflexota bacterium]